MLRKIKISSRKPVLGAIGSLAATGLSAGIPAIIIHIAKRNRIKNNADQGFNGIKQQGFNGSSGQQEVLSENLEPKYKEILQNIVKSKNNNSSNSSSNNMQNPLTNMIGSGIKSF